MKVLEILEGMMKRSDPYISGEKSGKPIANTETTKKTSTPVKKGDSKIETFAKKAKMSPESVKQIWDDEKSRVDNNHPNKWAIVTNNVKKRIGIE